MTEGAYLPTAVPALLLRLLRDRGPLSRAELGELVELPRSKITTELDRLTGLGLVETAGLAQSRGGRRPMVVRLASELRFVGVKVGTTRLDVGVVDSEMRLVEHLVEDLDLQQGPGPVLARIVELVGQLRERGVVSESDSVGVGLPCPVAFPDGTPHAPATMPGWDQHPVQRELTTALRCPVLVDNDANVMALGEKQAGAARYFRDFLFVKVGAGVSCGVFTRGELHRGATGSAGDIGHIQLDPEGPPCSCGNLGCLDTAISGAALGRAAQAIARSGESPWLADRHNEQGLLSAADLTDAVVAGDPAAARLVRTGGRRLGGVLAGLVNFFNPDLIVLGGGVTGIGHSLIAEVRGGVYRGSTGITSDHLPVVPSELGRHAAVIGAAVLAGDLVFAQRTRQAPQDGEGGEPDLRAGRAVGL